MPSPSSPLSPCHRRPQIDDAMNSSPSKYKSNNFCITGGAGNDGRCDMGMLPSPPRSPPGFLAPKRLFKPNPIMVRSREESENARRSLFLKKVQNGREDQRMIARGGEDEIMRMIFVAELKRWEASLERAASRIPTIVEEDEEPHRLYCDEKLFALTCEAESSLPPTSMSEVSPDEFDELLDKDGEELEQLLAQMDLDLDDSLMQM